MQPRRKQYKCRNTHRNTFKARSFHPSSNQQQESLPNKWKQVAADQNTCFPKQHLKCISCILYSKIQYYGAFIIKRYQLKPFQDQTPKIIFPAPELWIGEKIPCKWDGLHRKTGEEPGPVENQQTAKVILTLQCFVD